MILNKSAIIFGRGDVLITSAIGVESGAGKILFDELEKSVKIGTSIKNISVANSPHPVELIFEDVESIDVLIKSLKTCKKEMINHQKREKGEKV